MPNDAPLPANRPPAAKLAPKLPPPQPRKLVNKPFQARLRTVEEYEGQAEEEEGSENAIARGIARAARDIAQAQIRANQVSPVATAPPQHPPGAIQDAGNEDDDAQDAQDCTELGILEWAQYPIPYSWPEGNRLWLLCRAGNRWWFHDEGWRNYHRCDPRTMLAPNPAEVTPPILTAVVVPAH